MKFEEMGLEETILNSLQRIQFESPTKIQEEAIPLIKAGHDVFGQSATGSGKTAAFGIPLLEKMERGKGVQALVLEPTRELAKQVAGELKKFSRFKKVGIATVYGGVSFQPQIKGVSTSEVVVGTPGRIMDLMRKGHLSLSNIKLFVLDEADKMIDMGFFDDMVYIAKQTPDTRQTLLFSATMPEKLKYIRQQFSRDAKVVEASFKVREDMLKQYYIEVPYTKKFSLLMHLVAQEKPEQAIVFCNARYEADDVAWNLREQGINAKALHGGMPQNKREKTINQFHDRNIAVLVATDVAGRGLDIRNVSHIFNYSIPSNAEDYANRIGRTARAGDRGTAYSLLSRDDHENFRRVQQTFDYDIEGLNIDRFAILPFKKRDAKEKGRSSPPQRGAKFSKGQYSRGDRRPRKRQGGSWENERVGFAQ
ncbi:MAG: DEAD/DEAH box helicase [Candidatus Methanofastidiosa archaeon]|nr:DEAD/DEAH box helicase [Candidatus Methanofastidiosa archaeon]